MINFLSPKKLSSWFICGQKEAWAARDFWPQPCAGFDIRTMTCIITHLSVSWFRVTSPFQSGHTQRLLITHRHICQPI
jgi:hypothetical protein